MRFGNVFLQSGKLFRIESGYPSNELELLANSRQGQFPRISLFYSVTGIQLSLALEVLYFS